METIITIFGSTGDLTIRKLLPAIDHLLKEQLLPNQTKIFAIGRRDYDTKKYFQFVEDSEISKHDFSGLKNHVEYFKLDVDNLNDYKALNDKISEISNKDTRKIFYLAVGPDLLKDIAENISLSTLVTKGDKQASVTFEKPFGEDLNSATDINNLLWQYFDENQIYRIDHYLGKEMIQNILTVRFGNKIFENSWNNHAIKSIRIIVKENETIFSRAGYYDKSGALKDMVQSHLLQMLALIGMEVPLSYQSEDLKNEKVEVLKKLRYDSKSLIIGQYEGYLNETNIPSDSKTETFVFLKAFVDTPRFKGVPFYLLTGKALDKKESLIEVEFEESSQQQKWHVPLQNNVLTIQIAPLDGIRLRLNSKVPGLKEEVEQVELDYCIACDHVGNMPEAYEKLFLDMNGHHKSLFTRWDEILNSWKFVDQVKYDIRRKNIPLVVYKSPKELYDLILEREGVYFENI